MKEGMQKMSYRKKVYMREILFFKKRGILDVVEMLQYSI